MSKRNIMICIKNTLHTALALITIWFVITIALHCYTNDAPILESHHYERWWNIEVPAHIFNTLKRYDSTTVSEHWFAIGGPRCPESLLEQPCINAPGTNQPYSAMLSSSKLGNQTVYTSFPPGATIAYYYIFKIYNGLTQNALSIRFLQILNLLLLLISSLLFFFTLKKLSNEQNSFLLFLAVIPFLINVESLHSHHLSIWSHQLFQVILAATLLLCAYDLNRKIIIALGLLSFIGAWIEWTSYLLSVAIFIMLIFRSKKELIANRTFLLSTYIIFSITGGITLLIYYNELVGLDRYFTSLLERAGSRTFVDYYSWNDWFKSLFQSYGSWLLATLLLAIIWLPIQLKTNRALAINKRFFWLIFISSFILIENIMMFEHAIVYTFDRLKWGFVISLIIYFLLSESFDTQSILIRKISILIILSAVVFSIWQFQSIYTPYWR
jgi:hypothetical protein